MNATSFVFVFVHFFDLKLCRWITEVGERESKRIKEEMENSLEWLAMRLLQCSPSDDGLFLFLLFLFFLNRKPADFKIG